MLSPLKFEVSRVDCIKFGEIHQFVLKILCGNENLISIKGHNSVTNFQKMIGNNPALDLVNINAHTKFGQNLFISSQDNMQKRKYDINQGP